MVQCRNMLQEGDYGMVQEGEGGFQNGKFDSRKKRLI